MTRVGGVITAHNQLQWIEASLTTLRPEVDELVVVDDGSSDGTAEFLAANRERWDYQLVSLPTSRGVSEACNLAIDAISSDIVLFQGGDDRSLSGRRERSVEALADPTVVLVDALPRVIDGDGRLLPDDAAGEFVEGGRAPDALAYLFWTGNFVCAPSVALRPADYREVGGMAPGIDLLQDYGLWLDLAARGRFARVAAPLIDYRKHGRNLSREVQGVESTRQKRHAAEWGWIRNKFLDRATSTTLSRIAMLPHAPGVAALTRDEHAMLVRIRSRDPFLARRGLDDLFDFLRREGVAGLDRLGFTRGDIDELAAVADPQNLAALGRARAVIERLVELTTG